MSNLTATDVECLCGSASLKEVHVYHEAPKGEILFGFNQKIEYLRKIVACSVCGHYLSLHDMDDSSLYSEEYVNANYKDASGIKKTFDKINALDPSKSDNIGRVKRILHFAGKHFEQNIKPSIMDIGSGLCVFLYRMKKAGWAGTAVDPDARAIEHAVKEVGVKGVCGDFMKLNDLEPAEVISFNKVLEHVKEPIEMLAASKRYLKPNGFVYIELPDGEKAKDDPDGYGREEFFIDHHHIFSFTSLSVLASKAGFTVKTLERLQEPSTKYTLRAFLTLN